MVELARHEGGSTCFRLLVFSEDGSSFYSNIVDMSHPCIARASHLLDTCRNDHGLVPRVELSVFLEAVNR